MRCQHAERGEKRAKQRQMFARGGAAVLSLAVIVAVGVAAATALRARSRGASDVAPRELAPVPEADAAVAQDTLGSPPPAVATPATTLPASQPAAPTPTPTLPAPPPAVVTRAVPVVPPGRTVLRDTMVAERAGDTVRVSFDLLLSRTRRPDKFESIVRSTLPQVYGALADSALRALPVGAVARAGDLITTLPETGFHIPIAGGRTIAVWPETRVGRDGPLVVAYRAVAVGNRE
ncbi:MAG TPA: hypothetical protein VM076_22915 [Gemmatimonadaceae bacterium]|nr:hypothetical protein [Gemmatimonadaceae bacterium]